MSKEKKDIGEEFHRIIKGLEKRINEEKQHKNKNNEDSNEIDAEITVIKGSLSKAINQLEGNIPEEAISSLKKIAKEIKNEAENSLKKIAKKIKNDAENNLEKAKIASNLAKKELSLDIISLVDSLPESMIQRDFIDCSEPDEVRPNLFSVIMATLSYLHSKEKIIIKKKED